MSIDRPPIGRPDVIAMYSIARTQRIVIIIDITMIDVTEAMVVDGEDIIAGSEEAGTMNIVGIVIG